MELDEGKAPMGDAGYPSFPVGHLPVVTADELLGAFCASLEHARG